MEIVDNGIFGGGDSFTFVDTNNHGEGVYRVLDGCGLMDGAHYFTTDFVLRTAPESALVYHHATYEQAQHDAKVLARKNPKTTVYIVS